MDTRKKTHKKQYHINTRLILSFLLGLSFITLILVVTMIAAAKNVGNHTGTGNTDQQANVSEEEAVSLDSTILGVVKEIDTKSKHITLFDVERQESIVLSYTGGTNITDKYGKAISINQISIGSMVDAACQQDKNKLTSMNISKIAWIYPDVNNMSINMNDKVMKIASSKYKYTEDIFVYDGKDATTVSDLAEQDEVTVWGYDETVWSITVTKGHGIVKLLDYEDYIGNNITIGYESMQQIVEDMEITVREGDFNLTVENGLYSATKNITVLRNQVNYVSLSDLGPDGLKIGKVSFEITPIGADLYIDGNMKSYSDPIDLNYGIHAIIVTLGGYTTYEGTIDVASESKTVKINLPEATSETEAVATETDNIGSDSTEDGLDGSESGNDDSDNTDTDNTTDDTSDDIDYASEDTDYTLNDGDSEDKSHNIYIKSPSGASVYLDGDYMGTAPCSFPKIIGNHVMTFIDEGYETMSYTVDVSNDGLDAYFTFPALSESE